eukprot:TRINITY_DN567_c0_g1_i6.p3 TRINITY_DN567_c0_g1~~TRINITY_DN567_c0_g1_i6.p3  ORF type:complete len:238 (+),score=-30.44 TRINITY_DN567_c0_g1_i6:487-1200(+)
MNVIKPTYKNLLQILQINLLHQFQSLLPFFFRKKIIFLIKIIYKNTNQETQPITILSQVQNAINKNTKKLRPKSFKKCGLFSRSLSLTQKEIFLKRRNHNIIRRIIINNQLNKALLPNIKIYYTQIYLTFSNQYTVDMQYLVKKPRRHKEGQARNTIANLTNCSIMHVYKILCKHKGQCIHIKHCVDTKHNACIQKIVHAFQECKNILYRHKAQCMHIKNCTCFLRMQKHSTHIQCN